jgi:pantoate--beta-alanine ligase
MMKKELQPGNLDNIKNKARRMLEENGFKVDYAEIANAKTFSLINEWDGKEKLIALIAAFMNEVRLIDNMFIN